MSHFVSYRKQIASVAAVVLMVFGFQNCSPEGFRQTDFFAESSGTPRVGLGRGLAAEDPAEAASLLSQAEPGQTEDLGFDCQIFEAENYVRCSRRSGIENRPGATYELPDRVEYAGRSLKLRYVYYGTTNADQQAYADANCTQKVSYPMGSGVYQYSGRITVPECKDDGTGQCIQESGCGKLKGVYSGARYYRNLVSQWTQTEILYDNSAELNSPKPTPEPTPSAEDLARAGYECMESGDFVRCKKALSKTPGTSYSTDTRLTYKGQTLKLRYIYFGTLNSAQQAYADANCTQPVDYYMGSGVYPAAATGTVPSCKDNGQCVHDTKCRKMKSPVGNARYVKTKVTGWSTAEAVLDNTGSAQIVAEPGSPGEVESGGETGDVPAGYSCGEYGDFIRCTKALAKSPGSPYREPELLNYKGRQLRVRTIYFGTSNGDQQAYADASCTQKIDYYMGSGVYSYSLSGTVPRCKENGQCVTETQCRPLTTPIGAVRYYRNNQLNWTTAEITYDNSGANQSFSP